MQQVLGGDIAEYAACPNTHLRQTFEHPDARARGISRIEISFYGCSRQDPLEYPKEILAKTFEDLQGRNLFYIQPAARQWENLANTIDRCCVFVDHNAEKVCFCRYGHTKTGRLGVVEISAKGKNIEDVAMHTMSDFGFRGCPIFRIDSLRCEKGKMCIAPLRCYRKEKDAKTILCPTKAPTKRYPLEPIPSIALPDTKHIAWIWREKTSRMGAWGKQLYETEEMQTERKISLLARKRREELLDLFATGKEERDWKEREKHSANLRVVEREDFARAGEASREYRERKEYYTRMTRTKFLGKVQKIYDLENLPNTFEVLGFEKRYETRWNSGRVYLLQQSDEQEVVGEPFLVHATGRLDTLLWNRKSIEMDERTQIYVDRKQRVVQIRVEEASTFWKEGREIPFARMELCKPREEFPDFEDGEEEEPTEPENTKLLQRVPTKEEKKAKLLDFEEGEYSCNSYAVFVYRKKERYVLYLGEKEKPAIGYWIDDAMERLFEIPSAPMLCRVGKKCSTPNGKKDRRIVLSIGKGVQKVRNERFYPQPPAPPTTKPPKVPPSEKEHILDPFVSEKEEEWKKESQHFANYLVW